MKIFIIAIIVLAAFSGGSMLLKNNTVTDTMENKTYTTIALNEGKTFAGLTIKFASLSTEAATDGVQASAIKLEVTNDKAEKETVEFLAVAEPAFIPISKIAFGRSITLKKVQISANGGSIDLDVVDLVAMLNEILQKTGNGNNTVSHNEFADTVQKYGFEDANEALGALMQAKLIRNFLIMSGRIALTI